MKFNENFQYVIDGGFLFHRVAGPVGQSFDVICENYIQYVRSNNQSYAIVVYDVYPDLAEG